MSTNINNHIIQVFLLFLRFCFFARYFSFILILIFFCVFVFVLLVSSMNLTYWSSCARINAPTTQLNGIHMGPITNELTPKEFSQIIATIYE